MRTTALTCAAVLACIAAAATPAHAQEAAAAPYAAVDDYLAERLASNGVPGAAYAVVSPDGIEHTAAWGEDGDGEAVTESTPFLWGSVAKPVTATAVMTLVEDGRVGLDEPVAVYLPGFRLADEDHSARITVRHLLEQTSGIPEGTGVTDRFEEREDPYGEAVADLADAEPFAEPGETFEYASANYLVLGAIVQAVSGQPYEQYLREAVLDPLGMDGAVATAEDAESVPDGHTYVFGQTVAIDARFDPTGPSYGYLGGTVTDLAHFAMAHLGGGSPVLEAASVEQMHTGAAEISETSSYGLGWYANSRHDGLDTSTVWHVGATPGYSASVILLPELDRALVMAQNAYGYFQDGPLIGAMFDAVRLLAGGEATDPGGDWLYPSLLGLLVALTAAAVAVVALTLRRLRRGERRPAPRWRTAVGMAAWTLGGLAVAYVAGVAVPSIAPSRTVLLLLTPDLGWGLYMVSFSALAVVAVRLWAGVLRLRAPN
ncbi:serine hydrolase domain-containing protein [Glycomyces tenuis]|uniref:serine hydrolase domain-containing protein n=1 Tax=Glycomyces tenuis TaxID=58116 RepID=UPI000421B7CF|nr:serine hydrolase domain-containing protein [Glycomyces tenuis]